MMRVMAWLPPEKLIVPTVTPPSMFCVVVPEKASLKFAIAPAEFGIPVPFQPGLPLSSQLALVPLQSDAHKELGNRAERATNRNVKSQNVVDPKC